MTNIAKYMAVYDRALDFYSEREAFIWMLSPHPQLEGETPVAVIDAGGSMQVLRILERLDAAVYL